MTNEFVINSITVSAFVELACNLTARLRLNSAGNEALFVFEDSKEVRSAAAGFYAGELLCAREYSRRVGDLRTKCRDLRWRATVTQGSELR